MINHVERAPGYLLSLHDELEAMGKVLLAAIPAGILLLIGAIYISSGVFGLIIGGGASAVPWIGIGAVVTLPGLFFGRRVVQWFRRVRSLKRGIALIEARQLKRAEGPLMKPADEGLNK